MGGKTNQNTSLELANALLMKAREAGIPLGATTLQQLSYLANGWNLAVSARPLVLDPPEAWTTGTIFRRLHQALARYAERPVADLVQYGDDLPFEVPPSRTPAVGYFSQQEYTVINKTWATYGSYDAEQLAMLTQGIGTPYQSVMQPGRSVIIPAELIREFFVALAKAGRGRGISAA